MPTTHANDHTNRKQRNAWTALVVRWAGLHGTLSEDAVFND